MLALKYAQSCWIILKLLVQISVDSGQKYSPFRNPRIFFSFLHKVYHVLICTHLPCTTRPPFFILVTGEAVEWAFSPCRCNFETEGLVCDNHYINRHGRALPIAFSYVLTSYSKKCHHYVFCWDVLCNTLSISFTCLERACHYPGVRKRDSGRKLSEVRCYWGCDYVTENKCVYPSFESF